MESNEEERVPSEERPLLEGLPKPANCSGVQVVAPLWTPRKILIFFLLAFVYFLNWNCFGLLLSFFPKEASKYGMNSTTVGLIFGIYNLVGFVASFYLGMSVVELILLLMVLAVICGTILYLTGSFRCSLAVSAYWFSFIMQNPVPLSLAEIPKMGPYFVLNAGIFVCGGANIVFGFLNLLEDHRLFTIFCFIARSVGALGGTAADTAIFVIVTREFRDSIGIISGLLEFFLGLGSAIGPVIGGYLYTLGGFRLPLVLTGGLLMATLPLVWIFLPRKVYPVKSGGGMTIKKAICIPGVMMISIASFIHVSAVNCIDPILEPYAEKFGVDTTGVGLLFLYFSLAYMVATPLTGYLLRKKSWRRVLVVLSSIVVVGSLLLMGPAPFLKSFLPSRAVWLLGVSMALCGIGDAVFYIPILPELYKCCHENGLTKGPITDSITSGLYTGFYNLGSFAGPVVGGIIADHMGFEWTTTIMAFIVAAQTVILAIFFCFNRREPVNTRAIEIDHPAMNNSTNTDNSYGSISTG